jgi:hypothetical protein
MSIISKKILALVAVMPALFSMKMAQSAVLDVSFTLDSLQPSYRADGPVVLNWRLTNHSSRSLLILSAMQTPDRQDFDPITLTLTRSGSASADSVSVINLMGKRTSAQRVLSELAPGASVTQSFDLKMFAAYYGVRLVPGLYRLSAQYDLGHSGILAQSERAQAFTDAATASPIVIRIVP